jgi:hypothetical protein
VNTAQQAIAYGLGQITHPSQNWQGLCQSFVRHCMGVAGWAPTAFDAAEKVPTANRHTDAFKDVPAGAAVYFKHAAGDPRPGHVVLSLGGGLCVSTDIYRRGMVDKAPLSVFGPHWSMTYLWWSFWTPFGVEPHHAA